MVAARLAFQFSWRVAESFLDIRDTVNVGFVGGRIRYIYINGEHAMTLRPTTGLFTIGIPMARLIKNAEPSPRFRVIVKGDREIKGSVLARDVIDMDPSIRPGDEVVIVSPRDELIGTGRAKVSAALARSLEYGEVVRVR